MLVNWDGECKYPCPCGKGEYAHRWNEYGGYPGIASEEWVMLCPDCKEKYAFDRRNRRGWVLLSALAEEKEYLKQLRDFQKAVVHALDKRCRETWRSLLAKCKSKKAVWELNVKHQAYNTVLGHQRGKTLEQVIREEMNRPFLYEEAKHILTVCRIEGTDPDSLVTIERPKPPASLPKAFQETWEKGWNFMQPGP